MIQGFTQNALVIYPLIGDYQGRGQNYLSHIQAASRNVKNYLEKNGITADNFITDDVALDISTSPSRWISTLSQGDLFFAKNNCVGMSRSFTNMIDFPDINQQMLAKYPNIKGASMERRYELVLKRDSAARREILKRYNLVILFKQPKSPTMRVMPKKESGIMYIEIDNTTFMATCYISDMKIGATELLGIKNGFMPAYDWEVD